MTGTGDTNITERVQAAVLKFETSIIAHTNYVDAIDAIGALHARSWSSKAGRNFKARGLLIIGASGSGKTRALESYQEKFPNLTLEAAQAAPPGTFSDDIIDRLQDGDIRRIVYVEVPERTTRRALVAAILEAFGYRVSSAWNASDLVGKIAFLAEQLGTELLFLDEGHHMINEKNEDAALEVTEFIKSLLNRLKVQIVIAGLPSLLKVNQLDPRTAQFRRRLQPSVYLAPYDWRVRSGRLRFLTILRAMELLMDLPEPSGLTEHDFAKRLYVASGGHIGILSKYFSEVLRRCLLAGEAKITKELLAVVHDSWSRSYCYDGETGIDFDEPALPDEVDVAGEPEGSSENNPFLCRSERLSAIWVGRSRRVEVPNLTARTTRLRAAGRAEFSAFSKVL